ncbi:MAG: MurR/RpiR family transcriptional regulator [Metamycoplasmataceae bacterium]
MKKNDILKTDSSLSELEKKIVQEINSNPASFLSLNIVEYAKSIFTTKSSISRLSQKLKFSSILEMKLFVNQELTKQQLSYNIGSDTSIEDRINNLRSYNNYAINETLMNLDLKNFQKICKEISNAKKIIIFGVGSSYLATLELATNLQKIGFNVVALSDVHNSILKVAHFTKNDLLICFSKSGKTKEVLFLNEATKSIGGKTLLITAEKDNLKNVDFTINLKDLTKDNRIIATSSKISQIILADAIFLEIYLSTKNVEKIENERELLNKWEKFQ